MLKYFLGVVLTLSVILSHAQGGWSWEELPDMPESVSNNAVTQGYCGDTLCVYSFSGIDETKLYSGIHLKSWRYNTVSEQWTSLPDVPDVQGKIAAAASTVNNKIYLMGGYHVNSNNTEISSEKNHVFDPETNSWLVNAADIPVAIDDHIQGVWNDSLIYLITGWSNSSNVNNVQIYDPYLDTWSEGTDVPSFGSYKVFGGAGTIIGDSIFYYGGVNNAFNTVKKLHRGIINPLNPTEIEWENLEDCPSRGYRCGAVDYEGRVYFIGGADDGYNYDGISYDTNDGVDALNRTLTWWAEEGIWNENIEAPYGVMDLRGLGKVSDNSWVICGGMEEDQAVSHKTYLLTLDTYFGVDVAEQVYGKEYNIYSVGSAVVIELKGSVKDRSYTIIDIFGRLVARGKLKNGRNVVEVIQASMAGCLVNIWNEDNRCLASEKIILSK